MIFNFSALHDKKQSSYDISFSFFAVYYRTHNKYLQNYLNRNSPVIQHLF
ncbi:hypothetical protein EC971742_0290 [Escherichia coli 97.1742]|nr:hypothetical protein EC971742_0290 [Escherichia coli 97.1742]